MPSERYMTIWKSHKAGASNSELMRQFGISRTHVLGILLRVRLHKKAQGAIQRTRARIRQRDDLDHQWDPQGLFMALGFTVRAQNVLHRYFKYQGKAALSIKELMDAILPYPPQKAPVWGCYSLGEKGYRALLDQMSTMDLGKHGNAEWRRRIKRCGRNS